MGNAKTQMLKRRLPATANKFDRFNSIPQRTMLLIFGYLNDITHYNSHIRMDELCEIVFVFYSPWRQFKKALDIIHESEKEVFGRYDLMTLHIGINYLEEVFGKNSVGLIAMFLHLDHPYIDKREVGIFISTISLKRTFSQHRELLNAFLGHIPYEQFDFVTASRIFLEDSNFKMPLDNQRIDRLIYGFAEYYYGITTKYKSIPMHQLVNAVHAMINPNYSYADFQKMYIRKEASMEYLAIIDDVYRSIKEKGLITFTSDENHEIENSLWKDPSHHVNLLCSKTKKSPRPSFTCSQDGYYSGAFSKENYITHYSRC